MTKKPFASGRVVNGQIVITLADGTEIKQPTKVSVTVEVEIGGVDDSVEITEIPEFVRKEVAATTSIPRSEILAYMESIRNMPEIKQPWYKRIFRRKH